MGHTAAPLLYKHVKYVWNQEQVQVILQNLSKIITKELFLW